MKKLQMKLAWATMKMAEIPWLSIKQRAWFLDLGFGFLPKGTKYTIAQWMVTLTKEK